MPQATDATAEAPFINRSVKLPRKRLRAAIKHAMEIDVSEQTLWRYQNDGRLAFTMILGAMASSVDDFESMLNADTLAERKRRGISPVPTSKAKKDEDRKQRIREAAAACGVTNPTGLE